MRLSARITTLELAETFVISRSAQDTADVVFVELEHDGASGYGEATPIAHYGQSAESALAYLEAQADALGDDPWALEEIESRLPSEEPAARAAIDAALHDLQGKLSGQPVGGSSACAGPVPRPRGRSGSATRTTWPRRTEAVAGRFKRLKLKLGGRDGLDVDRVRAVRSVTEAPLMVDVNEAWSLDEALESLARLAELGVEYCEQPLPARHADGPALKGRSALPIFVDEDCHTAADVPACAERAHGVNIKLAKSGGIREAVRIAHVARALGLGVMLGCMNESGLAVAAGAQIASLCDHVDLDGNLLLRHDPWPGVELVDGVQLPSENPGLGVKEAVPDPR